MITTEEWHQYLAIIINNNVSEQLRLNTSKYSLVGKENPPNIENIAYNIYNKLDLTIGDICQHQFILFTKLCYMTHILCTNGYIFYEYMNIMNGIEILNFMSNTSILIKNISSVLVEFDDKVQSILSKKNICESICDSVRDSVREKLSIVDGLDDAYDNFIKNMLKNFKGIGGISGITAGICGGDITNNNRSIILSHFNDLIKSIISRNIIIYIIEITLGEIIDTNTPVIDEIMQLILKN